MPRMSPRALVTGATGFVGSRLVGRLLEKGWSVHVLARPTSQLIALPERATGLIVHRVTGPYEELADIVRKAAPDVVFHLASRAVAEHTPDDLDPLIEANVAFPLRLLEAMAQANAHRLVNTGTYWQRLSDTRDEPVCLYASTKSAFEALVRYYVAARGLQCVTLHLYDTYGADDPRPKLFTLLAQAAMGQQPLAMSPGRQQLDLVHIDDVVAAFEVAAERLMSGRAAGHRSFAVRAGRTLSLRQIVAIYQRVKRVKLNVAWGARPYREREVMRPWRGVKRLPGWRPMVSVEEGIARL
jgi:nucleoside-diphosphate-sugar epimerase